MGMDWGSHALLVRMCSTKTTLKIPWPSLKLNVHPLYDSPFNLVIFAQKNGKCMSIKWLVHEGSSVLFVMGRKPGNNPNTHQKVAGWTNWPVHMMDHSAEQAWTTDTHLTWTNLKIPIEWQKSVRSIPTTWFHLFYIPGNVNESIVTESRSAVLGDGEKQCEDNKGVCGNL